MEPLEAVQAEADTAPEGVKVPLVTDAGEYSVLIPPPGRWRTRANHALRQGDFDEWAELILSPADYTRWQQADPTNDDVEALFAEWERASGESRGKSSPLPRPSRSARRR